MRNRIQTLWIESYQKSHFSLLIIFGIVHIQVTRIIISVLTYKKEKLIEILYRIKNYKYIKYRCILFLVTVPKLTWAIAPSPNKTSRKVPRTSALNCRTSSGSRIFMLSLKRRFVIVIKHNNNQADLKNLFHWHDIKT